MLPIVKAPHTVLSQQAKPLPIKEGAKLDKATVELIEEMKQTLNNTKDPEGVGLAAPQIGKSVQLFIVKPTLKSPISVFINPQLKKASIEEFKPTKQKKSSSVKLEGCLSLPTIWGKVQRDEAVTITYLDENAKLKTQTNAGFFATILQHEYDHLQGVLFPKRVFEQQGTLYKSHKNQKGEEIFEEIEL